MIQKKLDIVTSKVYVLAVGIRMLSDSKKKSKYKNISQFQYTKIPKKQQPDVTYNNAVCMYTAQWENFIDKLFG